MKLLFLSIRLFSYGFFCDTCMTICTKLAERALLNNKPLTKKMLVFFSRISDKNIIRWQLIEKKFIQYSLEKQSVA